MRKQRFWLGTLLLSLVACGGKKTVHIPPPKPAVLGAAEVGVASWYGHPYHGRRTSSGEVYDMNQMTAAHLRLPFGAWVRVTNLSNGRSVDVRITDRGPFVKRRIIDLSRAAAREIQMLGPGTARVRVEVIATPAMAYRPATAPREQPAEPEEPKGVAVSADHPPEPASGDGFPCGEEPFFGVQVGWFRNYENAERLYQKMLEQYGEARILHQQRQDRSFYQVVVGREAEPAAVDVWLGRLREDRVDGFITRIGQGEAPNCL